MLLHLLLAQGPSQTDWMPSAWTLSGWLYALLVLSCLLTVLLRKEQSSAALGWSLAIVFLPGLGPLLFLLLGTNRISRRLRHRIAHREQFDGPRAAGESPDTAPGAWTRLDAVLEQLDQPPSRGGNTCEIYTEGDEAFRAMQAAMAAAREHIHVQFYIFRDDELGRRAIDLLCAKAREGVEVRLLVDGIGSLGTRRLHRQLRAAGGRVESFLPLWSLHKLTSLNLRNHRKLVICDGRVGFCGGLNVGVEYLGRRRNRNRPWADLHMRIEGPAVWDLQWIFAEDWHYSCDESLDDRRHFPALPSEGGQHLQVLAGGPDLDPNPIREALLGAIHQARQSIWITTPYLIPDQGLRDALTYAARAGVEVRILTQHPPPDHWLPFLCLLEMIEGLGSAGVEVLGYRRGMMHAKAVVIDGSWGLLGTANLDNRSMHLNFEVMVMLRGGAGSAVLRDAVAEMMEGAELLDGTWLVQRPRWQRGLARGVRLLAPLL